MPYTKVQRDGRYCVYKEEDGNAVGESLGCHDTEGEADDQIAALYAVEEEEVSEQKKPPRPPDYVISAMRRGIEQVDEGLGGDGLEAATIREARSIVSGELPTRNKIDKAVRWYARNQRFANAERDTPQNVSINLWGGPRGGGYWRRAQSSIEDDNVSEIVQISVMSEFRGMIPDVPLATGINSAELISDDEDPMFVTLPVAKYGAVSKNGLIYDDRLVGSIEEQINSGGMSGITGHLKEEDRETAYPIPDVYWVGAKRHGSQLWAKGYIPQGASRVREHIRLQKATRGKVATSIYGRAAREMDGDKDGRWRAREFLLESLDLAPWERAALPLGSEYAITAEMYKDNNTKDIQKMTDKDKIIAELTVGDIPQQLKGAILAEAEQAQEYREAKQALERVSEMESQVDEMETRISELQAEKEELNKKYEESQVALAEYEAVVLDSAIDRIVSEQVKVKSARPVIKKLLLAELDNERSEEEISKVLGELIQSEHVKPILDAMAVSEYAPSLPSASGEKNIFTEDFINKARAKRGF